MDLLEDAIRASRIFPRLIFIVTNTAVIGTTLTFYQMQSAGWFAKRPPLAYVQAGKELV